MINFSKEQIKQLGIIAVISIFSSIFSVVCYRWLEERNSYGQDPNYVKYSNYYDAIFAGRAQKYFKSSAPTNFIKGANISAPSVVNIRSIGKNAQNNNTDSSAGSGVIVSPDGYIVTNNHVIDEGVEIEVALNDRRKFIAKKIGVDPSTDIALLKIEAQNLPSIIFGNSDSLQIGEWVLAVGNPFDLSSTVTAGIVSAKARNINILNDVSSIESFIQTDAAVNPGNSGGALVNTNGELIGINTAIITQTGQYEGYSFAIPSNLVQKVIKDIKEFGVVQRGFLGVTVDDVSDELAKSIGLPSPDGVEIRSVSQGGACEQAGLLQGDIILSINNNVIKSTPELQEIVGRERPGNTLDIDFFRNGQKMKAAVILRNQSNSTAITTLKSDKVLRRIGIELKILTTSQIKKFGGNGVMVNSIIQGSIVSATNMDPGFVITKVNNIRVTTIEEITSYLEKNKGEIILEGFYEGYKEKYFYTFRI